MLEDTKRRGFVDPLYVIRDGAPGLIRALEDCFPRAVCGRCLAHTIRNLAANVPDDQWPEAKARAKACDEAPSVAMAAARRDDRVRHLLDRRYEEERRRLKIIPNRFSERPVLNLKYPTTTRASDRWRALKVTTFERKQLGVIQRELDDAHKRRREPVRASKTRKSLPEFPATNGGT